MGKNKQDNANGTRRSLRGNRIDYQKLCQSKTFSGFQCHQCKTQITEDEENICLGGTQSSKLLVQGVTEGIPLQTLANSATCKYRFCNPCLSQYKSLTTKQGQKYSEIWNVSYTCPVCLGICGCLSCQRQKHKASNHMQKLLKSFEGPQKPSDEVKRNEKLVDEIMQMAS